MAIKKDKRLGGLDPEALNNMSDSSGSEGEKPRKTVNFVKGRMAGAGMAAVRKSKNVIEIDPFDVWVDTSGKYNRFQELLNKDTCGDLIQSIKEKGQQVPGMVRKNKGPNGEAFELVFGSRRLWSCRYVAENEKKDTKFVADVVDLTDKEMYAIRAIENDKRSNPSDLENAKYYLATLPDFDTKAEAAAAFEIEASKFSRMLALAEMFQEHPDIEKAFANPLEIKLAFGAKIRKWMEKADAKKRLLSAAKELAESGGKEAQKVMNTFKVAYEGENSEPRVKKVKYGHAGKEFPIAHRPGERLLIDIPHYYNPTDEGFLKALIEALPSEI